MVGTVRILLWILQFLVSYCVWAVLEKPTRLSILFALINNNNNKKFFM